MTVSQLQKVLAGYPDNMEVMLHCEDAEFTHFPLEKVEQYSVRFSEDPEHSDKEPYADEECLILKGDI